MKIVFDMVTAVASPKSISYKWTFNIPLSDLKKSGLDLRYSSYLGKRIVYSSSCSLDFCEVNGIINRDNVTLFTYPIPKFGLAVDRTNPEAVNYFTNVGKYYVEKYDIDGWRLDSTYNTWNPKIISGDHSILKLTKSMKSAITGVKPDAVFLAENPSVELDETSEISYLSYDRFKSIGDGIVTGKIGSQELVESLMNESIGNNRTRAYFGETHDSPRVNKIFPQFNKPLLVLISTIPGVPMIQAGQEIGAKNDWYFSLRSNPKVDWKNGDHDLRDFYRKVFRIRNNNSALKYGSLKNVWKAGGGTYAYLRSYGNDTAIVVINVNGRTVSSTLDLPLASGTILYDKLSDERFYVSIPGNFGVSIPAYGSRILVTGNGT
jgi:glycosidase